MEFFNEDEIRLLESIHSLNNANQETEKEQRRKKINLNKEFHRKNPKSIEYHEEMKHNNTMETSMQKSRTKNNAVKTKDPNTIPEDKKLKNNSQLMFDALSKHYRKENIYFNNSKGYEHILVFRNYTVSTSLYTKKETLTIKVKIGEFNLKKSVIKNHTKFSQIKSEFEYWLQHATKDINPKEALDKEISHIFSLYKNEENINLFLPKLEEYIIAKLKKPSKQQEGYIESLNSIKHSWLEEAKEISYIDTIEEKLNLSLYEESFPLARNLGRKFKIFIGPTNSGKTYNALNALAEANKGVYLGPLRLMAHEGKDSLTERGVVTNLITGEERVEIVGATHNSSTIEMCSMNNIVDVAVIDEIQMIADENRGWAWSQALIGVPAKEVILVGSEEALPYVLPILEHLKEEYEIVRFERKNELKQISHLPKLRQLKPGDCIVVFSRKNALEMKNAVEAAGHKCSVIYGNLSPEVRKKEAAKFKEGENQILIATDAIGMGLNLPINRLFFSTLEKYDGVSNRLLTISEVKQIAGRAGRFGFSNHGEVGLLFDDNALWRNHLNKAIYSGYEEAIDKRIFIAPNLMQLQTICHTIEKDELYSSLIFFKEKLIKEHSLYKTANLDDMLEIAKLIRKKPLELSMALNYACLPIDPSSELHMRYFFSWLSSHIENNIVQVPNIPDVVLDKKNDSYSLYEAENYVKVCMAYRWLHYRYPQIYPYLDEVTENAKITNEYIEYALTRHIFMNQRKKEAIR